MVDMSTIQVRKKNYQPINIDKNSNDFSVDCLG